MLFRFLVSILVLFVKIWLWSLFLPTLAFLTNWQQNLSSHLVNFQIQAISPPSPLPSSNLIFFDDFEMGLEKWEQVRGLANDWYITSDGWLEVSIPSSFSISELIPKDQYWQNDWQNYQIEFEYEVLSEADVNWSWAYQDERNWCELHLYAGRVNYTHLKNNKAVFRALTFFDLNKDQKNKIIIRVNQGKVQAWADDQLVISFQDTYPDIAIGKIALKATTGAAFPTQVRFDNLRVYALDEQSEEDNVLLALNKEYKQYQQPWRDLEYDHALDWSSWGDWRVNHPDQPPKQVTIYHWGCALTSLAMVMRYHDLNYLPSGVELTPESLNKWLTQEADGYIGEGSLNWLAAIRLSKEISEQYSTIEKPIPKLEYQRHSTNLQVKLKEMIDGQRPSIIQITGHFLVGNGYLQETETRPIDFYISDPAYSYSLFSQHDQTMTSVIELSPSHTDLSYLMMVYSPQLQVDLFDQISNELLETDYQQDTLVNQFYHFDGCLDQVEEPNFPYPCVYHHPAPLVQLLPKPDSMLYRVVGTGLPNKLSKLQLYLYDQGAQVKMVERFFFLAEGGSEVIILVNFDKNDSGASEVIGTNDVNFSGFRSTLLSLYQQAKVPALLFIRLNQIANRVLENENDLSDKDIDRYQQLCLKLLYYWEDELKNEVVGELARAL